MANVTFNGLRLNSADTNPNWANKNGGGPSPASEPQLRYQGSGAVNRKVTSTGSRNGVQYSHTSSIDMLLATRPLWFIKAKVADAGDLNTTYGCEADIGSGSANHYTYNLSGSGANNDQYSSGYNSQGGLAEGFIISGINPTVAQWRESTVGSPNLNSVNYFAFAAQFITGGAKSENLSCDAVDIGVGLDYNGTNFSFADGVAEDQGIVGNRWGAACQNGTDIFLRGYHRVGPTSTTSGVDNSEVRFPDGYHGTGDFGIGFDTTFSTVSLNGTYTGLGRRYGSDDTRPNLTFEGDQSVSSVHSGTFNNFNVVTLLPSAQLDGADMACSELFHNATSMNAVKLRSDSLLNQAVCSDFTLDDVTDLTVEQIGQGHFVNYGTISSDTEINWTPVTQGFPVGSAGNPATTSSVGDETILVNVNAGSTLTINVSPGVAVPSVKNDGAGTVAIVVPEVVILFTFTLDPTGGEFRIYDEDGDGNEITLGTDREGVENLITTTYSLSHPSAQAGSVINAQFMHPGVYEEVVRRVVLGTSDQTINVEITPEEN